MSFKIIPPFKVVLRKSEENDLQVYETSIRRIREITLGKDNSFPRVPAMSLLLASDFSDKHLDFQLVLENEHEAPDIRYFAAIYLGKMNTPATLAILHTNCRIQDQQVLVGVMKALGRIGNKKTLDIIASARMNAKGLAETHAHFAAALIAHRYGLQGNEIPVPADSNMVPLPASKIDAFQITLADKEETRLCLLNIKEDPYGIEIGESGAYSILCKRSSWMLLFNSEYNGHDAVRKLSVNKSFLGLVARKSEETRGYSVALLLLTSPAKGFGSINLFIVRTNGDLVFSGLGKIKANQIGFSINAVSRPGALAMHIEGIFANDQLSINSAQSSEFALVKKRQPTREERKV